MDRKDWLFVTLQLIIIAMLVFGMVMYYCTESQRLKHEEWKEDQENKIRTYEVLKEIHESLDYPGVKESLSPELLESYLRVDQLYPYARDWYSENYGDMNVLVRGSTMVKLCGVEKAGNCMFPSIW